MIPGIEVSRSPLSRVVGASGYGRQHLGFPPGGPMDRFGMWVGNVMLGQDRDTPALEVVHANEMAFTRPAAFVLTGVRRARPLLRRPTSGETIHIRHAVVTPAEPGDQLVLGTPERGLRTYVCVRFDAPSQVHGRARPPFDQICHTTDPDNAVRVLAGPEVGTLAAPEAFVNATWEVTRDLSDVGIRLSPVGRQANESLRADPAEITSGPVADGTVQLTPAGPLILMRQRPTLGGYPRIATVIDVDVDRLAQYTPGQAIRFRWVSNDEALGLLRRREEDLSSFAACFHG